MATLCKVFLAAIIFLMFFYSTTLAMNLSLRFGCGTRGVLSFELTSGNGLADEFFILGQHPILKHLSCFSRDR